jgi:hypothetical protein
VHRHTDTRRGGEYLVNDIAGIARSGWLEKENFGFRLSHRAVLDAAWDDAKLTALQHHVTIAKLNGHLPAPNEKHFVFAFVVMPWEHASKLDQLHFLAIQLGYDLWPPMFWISENFSVNEAFNMNAGRLRSVLESFRGDVLLSRQSLAQLMFDRSRQGWRYPKGFSHRRRRPPNRSGK